MGIQTEAGLRAECRENKVLWGSDKILWTILIYGNILRENSEGVRKKENALTFIMKTSWQSLTSA